MSTNEQPLALQLAEELQSLVQTHPQMSDDEPGGYCGQEDATFDDAASELRRLHAVEQERDELRAEVEQLRARERACPTMAEAAARAMMRAMQEIAAALVISGDPSPADLVAEVQRMTAATPAGWMIKEAGDGVYIITHDRHGGGVARQDDERIPAAVLAALCGDLLASAHAAPVAQPQMPWGYHAGDGSPAHPAARVAQWPERNRSRMVHAVYAAPVAQPPAQEPLTPAQIHADELLVALRGVISEAEHVGCDGWMTGCMHSDDYDAACSVIDKIEAAGQEGGAA